MGAWGLQEIYKKGIFGYVYSAIYIFLLVMAVILSLAMPLDKAKGYFTVITVAFSFLTIITLAGIVFTFA